MYKCIVTTEENSYETSTQLEVNKAENFSSNNQSNNSFGMQRHDTATSNTNTLQYTRNNNLNSMV